MLTRLLGRVRLNKAEQFIKACLPILVTLSGISMSVRLVQLLNASEGMLVIPSGSSILVKLLQSENAYGLMSVTLFPIITDLIALLTLFHGIF